MRLLSSAFEDAKPIPTRFANRGVVGGENISIPLAWQNAPPGTKSFTISIIDTHPVAGNWIHWLVINIPKEVEALAEASSRSQMPSGAKELYNSFGETGYGGPQPPKGSGRHPYIVTLYALNTESLDLPLNSTLTAYKRSIDAATTASAKITGIYER